MDPKHLIALHVSTKEILRHSLLADPRPTHQFKLEEVTDWSCDRAMLFVDAIRRDVLSSDLVGCINLASYNDYLIVAKFLGNTRSGSYGNGSHVASGIAANAKRTT